MLWIVQRNLFFDNRRAEWIGALARVGAEVALVHVDRGQVVGEPFDEDQPILANGSVMLSRIARERGWSPGSFLNDNFSHEAWGLHYAEFSLNRDAVSGALGSIAFPGESAFARPVLDDKSFNGAVFSRAEFLALQAACLRGDKGAPKPATPVLVASPKKIGQEHRHFVVDGDIVTSSRYKLSGSPNFQEGADEAVLDLARRAISRWTPARAFVMDTYVAGDEIGIVEIGCIAHAGLYRADLVKLAHRLDTMDAGRPAPARSQRAGP